MPPWCHTKKSLMETFSFLEFVLTQPLDRWSFEGIFHKSHDKMTPRLVQSIAELSFHTIIASTKVIDIIR